MACVLVRLFVVVILIETFASTSSLGDDPAPSCKPRWSLLGQRCFAFYPVWTSWSVASSLCSQTGSHLASLHTPEEAHFVRQLAKTNAPVWLGGYREQQNGSWFWSDDSPFRISTWTNLIQEKTAEGGACMEMAPKSGELNGAPCGELRFYICYTRASSVSNVWGSSKKHFKSDIVRGVTLFDVMWSHSDLLAEEVLMSSSFLRELRDGHVTESYYSNFLQQEALYLHRVSSTLEALIINNPLEAGDMRSLLIDTLEQYNSRNQSLLASPPPKWLQYSLQTFHSVVLEEPIYWLVALSARACLRNFLARELRSKVEPLGSGSGTGLLYQDWSQEGLKEAAWIDRYKKVLEEHQEQMDVYKAVNIFREHMMNQKSLYISMEGQVI